MAKWLEKEVVSTIDGIPPIEEWQSARCSACGKYHTTPYMYYFDEYKFCPNCGQAMNGEDEPQPTTDCSQTERSEQMKRLWKKVTPTPIEFNGHGFLWDCTKCGYCLTSWENYPRCDCPRCGATEPQEREGE